jgi:superfamily I DNA/RNA helicase
MTLIEQLAQETADLALAEQFEHVIQRAGLKAFYEADSKGLAESRVENLDELVNAASRYEPAPEDLEIGLTPLLAFLSLAALEAGEGGGEAWQDCVQLMSLHSAKGLEFPQVFLVGLEEGLFPSSKSLEEPGRLEEERRLAYVGVTRAQKKLTLTYAESRRLHGMESLNRPSRFLAELPPQLVHEVRPRVQQSRPLAGGRELAAQVAPRASSRRRPRARGPAAAPRPARVARELRRRRRRRRRGRRRARADPGELRGERREVAWFAAYAEPQAALTGT